LHSVFCFSENVEVAREKINRLRQKGCIGSEWETGGYQFHFSPTEKENEPALFWLSQGIAGYNELGFSVGIGSPAESSEEETGAEGLFITTGNCAGFIPNDASQPADFRIPHKPEQAGIWVKQAVSFKQSTSGRIHLAKPGSISLNQLTDAICRIDNDQPKIRALAIADFNDNRPSISLCLVVDDFLTKNLKEKGFQEFSALIKATTEGIGLWGARFELDKIAIPPNIQTLPNLLKEVLTLDNILDVKHLETSELLVNPTVWIVSAENLEDASLHRIAIEVSGESSLEPVRSFLIRRLYTDSIRVELKKLHGGYSAQTFQVNSYDRDGRKLRPTVLKFANRAMITREADRCQKYSLPYILNNSAMVLGTEFFGDNGALRYNFVGIGGEQTQLKWLTHYFENWSTEQLEPLFDKIFMQILNPWYGQPVHEAIHPFRDHDPTFTFFPHIYDTAFSLFSISSDEEFFTIEETGQKLVNPYWFLKHEYKRRRETAINYHTSICHGDLNMQNILLDQNMNVYLIDFSETRPRSIVTDFARLEAIFMTEYAPLENEEDLKKMVQFATRFYDINQLDHLPENNYQDILNKNVALSLKMREYAFKSSGENTCIEPYYLALLEWTLPVICYSQLPLVKKRYAMILSALLCEKIRKLS